MDSLAPQRPVAKTCHVCGGARIYYLFSTSGFRVVRCEDCGFMFVNPQPNNEELERISREFFFDAANNRLDIREVKQATARLYLSEIRRYHGPTTGRLLEVGCGSGNFLVEAEAAGWQVTGVDVAAAACEAARQRLKNGEVLCGELPQVNLPGNHFDVCVLADVLEHVRSPLDLLREIHRVLKPGGTLFVATPSVDSRPARVFREKWVEFKAENLTYFDRHTLQTALLKSGFQEVIVQPGWKMLSFDYILAHFKRFPSRMLTPALKFAAPYLPASWRRKHHRISAGGIMAFSRKAAARPVPLLSVVLPAYNEAATVGALMEMLLHKELPGLQMEIVVVESNSTDGTREAVLKYQNTPGVKVILEERPQGKGHAVRTGLQAATGDYIMIQDADLEYDLEDYDILMEYLLASRGAFVLGSRHGGRNVMKMRQFTGQRFLSLFLNLGHWTFTTLINVLFFQRLRDPFTMYKVFRRDCLTGLEFQCNRFDFDYELLVKLIRKGYQPVELPVNYRSRSFREGKKVRMFSDPLTWLKALIWLRCIKIDPLAVVERSRQTAPTDRPPQAG